MLPPPPRSTLFPYTTLFRSRSRALAEIELFTDALVDEHVGVHAHTDGEREARDAWQRHRRAERREDRQLQEQVHHHRDIGDEPGAAVIDEHEDEHEDAAADGALHAELDGVAAERRP